MACIRTRRGRYILDYRDAAGNRKWRTFPMTEEGLKAAEAALGRLRGSTGPAADTTFGEYSKQWLDIVKRRVSDQTLSRYEITWRVHMTALYRDRVVEITRRRVKAFLVAVRDGGASAGTTNKVLSLLRNILAEAVDDGLIQVNPAAHMAKRLGLTGFTREKVRAMDADQYRVFLATLRATEKTDDVVPLLILAYTGMRIGEMAGVLLDDVFEKVIAIERQVLQNGKLKLPKGDKTRTVDVADGLRAALESAAAARREYDLHTARRSPWLVYPDSGGPTTLGAQTDRRQVDNRVRRVMARVLRRAKLPTHFTPHSLRHTYASLLLQRGESLLYVSRQLGHATIKLTADLYGRWLPIHHTRGGPNLLLEPLDPKQAEAYIEGREGKA